MLTGAQVRAGRKMAGWSQSALAARIGCTKVAVSFWELGKSPVTKPMENLLRRIFADEGIQLLAGTGRVQARRKRRKVA